MELVNLVADAVAKYDNASDRPETPSWITVDQLAFWLEKSSRLCEVDVYSVIAKTLGFIAYYCTPRVHHGLCVVAADPETYVEIGEPYNEIFIAAITEGWQTGDGNDDNIADKISEARIKIGQLVLDIIQSHSKPDLEQKQITWMNNKGRLEDNLNVWFESNGYLPESTKMEDTNDATPSVKLPPKAKTNPRADSGQRVQNPHAKADTGIATQASQQTQYINSQAEDSEVAPSPTSAGATITPVAPMGSCNFRISPHPVMFDAGIHDRSQLLQLEDHVLQQHGVTVYRDLSGTTPVCLSGHIMSPVQILEVLEFPPSPRGTACSCCCVSLCANGFAFTCFRCVASYYLTLPIDKDIASAGLSKGVLYCTDCAFRIARGAVQLAPASPLRSP